MFRCCDQLEYSLFQLGASCSDSIGDLLASREEQQVKRQKLIKEKNLNESEEKESSVSATAKSELPGVTAGPTKVCSNLASYADVCVGV